MSALQAQLDAAVDVDSLRFSGREYADARFGAVKGRIARRRAARSAGIGGASLVGVGAVAFGAGQVPWSGFVLGSNPGGSPTVVCTTSTPDAVAGLRAVVPDGAIFMVLDKESGAAYFVGAKYVDSNDASTGTPLAWTLDGKGVPLTTSDANVGSLALPSGATVEVNTLTGGVTASDPNGVTITPATSLRGAEPSASPSVTCVTTTPEPLTSASATPSLSPTAGLSEEPIAAASPFECGFPIEGDHVDDALTIGHTRWATSAAVNDQLKAHYGDTVDTPQAAGGGDVVSAIVTSSHLAQVGDLSSGWSQRDPVTSAELDLGQVSLPLDEVGLTFAAVVDGKVVGLVEGEGAQANRPFVWLDSLPGTAQNFTFLNPENSMTFCEGYGPDDDADLYVIAGTVTINADGSTSTPIYSWKKVTPAP